MYDGMMCIAYVWRRLVEGQGQSLRLNIVWLYFESALYFWTPGGIYKQLSWNVSYNETMCSAYVWPRLVQGQGKKLTLLPLLHMGYSSPSVKALVYEFTLLYKKKFASIQWHTGGDMIAFVSESTRLVCFVFSLLYFCCFTSICLKYYAMYFKHLQLNTSLPYNGHHFSLNIYVIMYIV